jgi:hypothetical protein
MKMHGKHSMKFLILSLYFIPTRFCVFIALHLAFIRAAGGILFVLYLYFFVFIVLCLPFVLYCTTQTCMPPAGFELTIPPSERTQTLSLHRSATGIGRDSNQYISAPEDTDIVP